MPSNKTNKMSSNNNNISTGNSTSVNNSDINRFDYNAYLANYTNNDYLCIPKIEQEQTIYKEIVNIPGCGWCIR